MKTAHKQNLVASVLLGALAFTSADAQQVPILTSAAAVPGPVPGNTMTKANTDREISR